jgi:hypothetical protein
MPATTGSQETPWAYSILAKSPSVPQVEAAAALYAAGRPALAWALAVLYVINRVLMYVWGQ